MKIAATATLLFATLALANPAPVAHPNAAAAPAAQPKFEPIKAETREQLSQALAPRVVAEPEPEINAVAAGIRLDARDPKKKPKGGSSGNDTSAAGNLSPSLMLELSALGLGVIEVVRLWG